MFDKFYVDHDFVKQINHNLRLTTINVLYYYPDYENLLQQFIWQTMDKSPHYPRAYKFIDYWKSNIDATIATVRIASCDDIKVINFRHIDHEFK